MDKLQEELETIKKNKFSYFLITKADKVFLYGLILIFNIALIIPLIVSTPYIIMSLLEEKNLCMIENYKLSERMFIYNKNMKDQVNIIPIIDLVISNNKEVRNFTIECENREKCELMLLYNKVDCFTSHFHFELISFKVPIINYILYLTLLVINLVLFVGLICIHRQIPYEEKIAICENKIKIFKEKIC